MCHPPKFLFLPLPLDTRRESRLNVTVTSAPDPAQTGTKTDLLSDAPDCILSATSEWLAEKERLSLMHTSRRHHQVVYQFFFKKLKPGTPGVRYPALLYRVPAYRQDRFIPMDQPGRAYLTALGIHYPLTVQIQNGKTTLEQALATIEAQRRQIQTTLTSTRLDRRQRERFGNSLFTEHLLNDRCNLTTALRMAKQGLHLFHSMTLQHLFRTGCLDPADLDHISGPGLQLVHDPLLVGLFQDGLIRKQDVLCLTQIQFDMILICQPALVARKLAMKNVLAVSANQLAALRNTGLPDQLYAGRTTLDRALQLMRTRSGRRTGSGITQEQREFRRLVSTLPDKAMRKALGSAGRSDRELNWITSIGKRLYLLPPERIIEFMDTSTAQVRSAFADLYDGIISADAEQRVGAYIQIYINLAQHLNSADYLRVVAPFLSDVFGWMVNKSFYTEHPVITDQYCMVWALVRTQCAKNGSSIEPYRKMVMPMLYKNFNGMPLINIRTCSVGVSALARLLKVMDLLDDEAFFHIWNASLQKLGQDIDEPTLDCLHALYSPFGHIAQGAMVFDLVGAKIDKKMGLTK